MNQIHTNWKIYSPATGEEIAQLKETSLDAVPDFISAISSSI